ncbi:hypothetical protein KBD87_02800 [Candidatus Saccharibacteria bacterium]|nr:hypothetical protein [Candidatus Saccharibacteria bacterium]
MTETHTTTKVHDLQTEGSNPKLQDLARESAKFDTDGVPSRTKPFFDHVNSHMHTDPENKQRLGETTRQLCEVAIVYLPNEIIANPSFLDALSLYVFVRDGGLIKDDILAKNIIQAFQSYMVNPSVSELESSKTFNILAGLENLSELWTSVSTEMSEQAPSYKKASMMPSPNLPLDALEASIGIETLPREAVLIRAIDAVYFLDTQLAMYENGETLDEEAVMNRIFEAETVLAPLSYLASYDTLESSMLSKARKLRYALAGNKDALHAQKDYDAQFGTPLDRLSHLRYVMDYIGEDRGEDFSIFDAGKSDDAICMVSGLVDVLSAKDAPYDTSHENKDSTAKLRARVKTGGSELEKIARDLITIGSENPIMDKFAFTLISEKDTTVPFVYATLLENLMRHEGTQITFKASPSRNQPFHIKGTPEFVQLVREGLREKGIDAVDESKFDTRDDEQYGFHVAKVTFFLTHEYNDQQGNLQKVDLPVEIQVLSQDARDNARSGAASHIILKIAKKLGRKLSDKETHELTEKITALHERMKPDISANQLPSTLPAIFR